MPWRLIVFILVFGIFIVFIAFNLGNRCDISFGFYQFKEVPVFMTVFASFIVGMFCTLPFAFGSRFKSKKKGEAGDSAKSNKKKGDESLPAPEAGSIQGSSGPYGID